MKREIETRWLMNHPMNYSGIVPLVFLVIENDADREAITELYLSYRNLFIKVAREYFGKNDAEVEDDEED